MVKGICSLISLPTYPPGQVDLVLVVSSTTSPVTPPPYDFSDIAGKLTWQGDSVATQRSLRDEWS